MIGAIDEIVVLHELPLLELIGQATTIIVGRHDPNKVQKASLLSIKTGDCPENCAYCPQSAHHREVNLTPRRADDPSEERGGAGGRPPRRPAPTLFCMGAAWRQVRDGREFDAVIEMIKGVRALGMETCVTLGMLKPHQAEKLAAGGLDGLQPQSGLRPGIL